MKHRPWVTAPLAGAAIILASPPGGAAAHATVRHTPVSLRVREGDRDDDHRNPWRDCHSHRRVVLISPTLRAFLTNGRRGPEALVLKGTPKSTTWSPEQPWDKFTVAKYLNADYPATTTAQYAFTIKEFFRVHPLFVVNSYDNHKRAFPFPEAHCDDHNRDDGEDRDPPHGDRPSTGPCKDSPARHAGTAAGWSSGLLSTQHILIAAGGLIMLLGMLATAWHRRRRSND
ncbi:hypothetical protein [Streptomyces monashensis]|uniref:Gram-positive cocci surface proteins LPxTG domain-containing protein n=1 Tax=Streptomyces monashensis TaxID=1678012 RepID=A0A1S2QJT5_9ACTN|nr:hypothetical protein [Streptomyces monashensis]OIK06334.1 hypothetical protein BIV23_08045 [Streptomyces monashensis]